MRALRTALTLLLLAGLLECKGAAKKSRSSVEADDEEDSDEAPFMIVIEHVSRGTGEEATGEAGEAGGAGGAGGGSWRCAGSLVSLRTGVTSAECARAAPAMRELWALAAATAAGLASRQDGARRVSRIATAGAAQHEPVGEWSAALLDLAVLELESPFGKDTQARPILMATAPDECSENSVCNVVRFLAGRTADSTRLRIVVATLGGEAACARSVPQWPALRARALCFTGPELCAAERGAGVVCKGKLCGVLARSAPRGGGGGGAGGGGGGAEPSCGDTHAAQAVARWRRFLHCAHTLRSCGRGPCAELCSEQRLLDDDSEDGGRSPAPASPADDAPPADDTPPVDDAPPAPPAAAEREHELDVGLEREHAEHAERAEPRPHTVRVSPDLAPQTLAPEYANSTRVVPPARTRERVTVPPRQTSAARPAALARASPGRAPTRTAWTDTAPAQRTRTAARPHRPPTPLSAAPAAPAPPPSPAERHKPAPPPPAGLSTRRPASPATPALLPLLSPPASPSSVRPTPLFEPNRPDFRAGEYGDNAAEYFISDDGFPFKKSTSEASPPSSTKSAPRIAPPSPPPPRNVSAAPAPPAGSTERAAPPALGLVARRSSHSKSAASTLLVHAYGLLLTVICLVFSTG